MSIVERAERVAAEAHAGGVRKSTSTPYIEHPRAVAGLLAAAGCTEEVVAAAWLHDVVEDTAVTHDEIERGFGQEVARAVRDVSEDKTRSWEERKRQTVRELADLPTSSALVAFADKLDNVRQLDLDTERHGPAHWERFNAPYTRQRRYHRTLATAFEARGDLPAELVGEHRTLVDRVFPATPIPLGPLLVAVRARSTSIGSQIHGEAHWRTVAAVGHSLLELEPTADPAVVFAFALLHDTQRLNDARDPEHGPRAAAFARELHGEGMLPLEDDQLAVLCHALAEHTSGTLGDNPTTAVCWDADRLLLWRVEIPPDPRFLSSDAEDWAPWIDRWHRVWTDDDWPALADGFAEHE
jgi:hypothetical protein